MSNKKFDVIVVGAGPAGSMTGYYLAKEGVSVAIFDKDKFPREKACGGGLQVRAVKRIPVDLSPVLRGILKGITFSFRLGDRYSKKYHLPLVYSVLRAEFDNLLLESAQRSGAKVYESIKVISIDSLRPDLVSVQTNAGEYLCNVLVGADGANSITRKSINTLADYFWQVGLYGEIPEEYLNKHLIEYEQMRVDLGTLPSGYGWIFPKNGYCNIGVGSPTIIGHRLRSYLQEFVEREKVFKDGALEKLRFSGHKLPTLTKTTKFYKGSIILVGDAAGLVEPLTGDGISYALHSSHLAAGSILRNLNNSIFDFKGYDSAVKNEIVGELNFSRRLLSFFIAFPRLTHEVIKYNERVWEAFCKVLRGEESYGAFGLSGFIWHPVSKLASFYESRRLLENRSEETAFFRVLRKLFIPLLKRI
ncbi:MAG TPA: geranylgeranyl reductase family protein [Thermodesulfobacteriota bacterium]